MGFYGLRLGLLIGLWNWTLYSDLDLDCDKIAICSSDETVRNFLIG